MSNKIKTNKQISAQLQSCANKLKNIHEDTIRNQTANKMVDYTLIIILVEQLENTSKLLYNYKD